MQERNFSLKFLLTADVDCISLLPWGYTVLSWKFESGKGLQESEQVRFIESLNLSVQSLMVWCSMFIRQFGMYNNAFVQQTSKQTTCKLELCLQACLMRKQALATDVHNILRSELYFCNFKTECHRLPTGYLSITHGFTTVLTMLNCIV